MLLARTAQQDAEENVVLEKASVVEEARRKEAALRKAASQPARPGGLAWPHHALHEKEGSSFVESQLAILDSISPR